MKKDLINKLQTLVNSEEPITFLYDGYKISRLIKEHNANGTTYYIIVKEKLPRVRTYLKGELSNNLKEYSNFEKVADAIIKTTEELDKLEQERGKLNNDKQSKRA